ncbi:uncharacterized protein LOC121249441 [Juglans microcarpa x Juglans regia]|uniref:uncharacterized protein LOC121249441 n=1 Tax=Juglans microcarpa x Juglans regia TaxID=2249226 RepID=UPI001B7F0009|nr:uncharacterized protein LOC121249441 [Juglans microcarpa x Juglans regia]
MVGLVNGSSPAPSKTLPDNSPNLEYTRWSKQDNIVLSWLYASIVEKLVSIVLNLETQNKSGTPFKLEAKLISDQLAVVGKPVDEQDLITYPLSGLKPHFMPFITAYMFATRDKDLLIDDFQTEMLNYETLMESPNSSALAKTNFAFAASLSKGGNIKTSKGPRFSP